MLKLPRRGDLTDLPFAHVVTAMYLILLPLLIPIGFVLLVCTLAMHLKGLRYAIDPYEKAYWWLNVAGYALIVYAALVLMLLMADGMYGEPWKLSERWPSVFAIWYGAGSRIVAVLLDLLAMLAAGLGLLCTARYFGYVDESGQWCEPDWLIRQYRIDDFDMDEDTLLKGGRFLAENGE